MSEARLEGLTAKEELKGLFSDLRGPATFSESMLERLVDVIEEIIDERAAEKAEETIGTHQENYDHDLMYQ